MPGPTLNERYNKVLAKWRNSDPKCQAECEDCGKDLAGLDVYDTDTEWVCKDCIDALDQTDRGPSDIELRAFERRQLGITG
jgi:hypothetical protein